MHRKDDPRTLSACSSVRSKHQSRGRCCRAVEPAQLTARWEHAYLHLPGEGKEAGGSPVPHCAAATAQAPLRHCFASEQGGGLYWSPPQAQEPQQPWWDAPFPSLLQVFSGKQLCWGHHSLRHTTASTVDKQLSGSLRGRGICSAWSKGTACRRPKPTCLQSVGSGWIKAFKRRSAAKQRPLFLDPFPHFCRPRVAKRLLYPSTEAGMCLNQPWLHSQLDPIPFSPTHRPWDTMTKYLCTRCAVPPSPACQRMGRACHQSVKQHQMLPACWYGTKAPTRLRGGGWSQGQRVETQTHSLRLPACTHTHTQHAQMNPSLQLCPGLGTSARFTRSNATGKTALSPAEAHLNISVTSPFAKATRSGNPMHAGTRYRRAGCQEGKQL